MDKFEQKKMKKIGPIKNTWYDCLITYIPEPIRESVGGFKDEIVFKINSTKHKLSGRGKKLSKEIKQWKIN